MFTVKSRYLSEQVTSTDLTKKKKENESKSDKGSVSNFIHQLISFNILEIHSKFTFKYWTTNNKNYLFIY